MRYLSHVFASLVALNGDAMSKSEKKECVEPPKSYLAMWNTRSKAIIIRSKRIEVEKQTASAKSPPVKTPSFPSHPHHHHPNSQLENATSISSSSAPSGSSILKIDPSSTEFDSSIINKARGKRSTSLPRVTVTMRRTSTANFDGILEKISQENSNEEVSESSSRPIDSTTKNRRGSDASKSMVISRSGRLAENQITNGSGSGIGERGTSTPELSRRDHLEKEEDNDDIENEMEESPSVKESDIDVVLGLVDGESVEDVVGVCLAGLRMALGLVEGEEIVLRDAVAYADKALEIVRDHGSGVADPKGFRKVVLQWQGIVYGELALEGNFSFPVSIFTEFRISIQK